MVDACLCPVFDQWIKVSLFNLYLSKVPRGNPESTEIKS